MTMQQPVGGTTLPGEDQLGDLMQRLLARGASDAVVGANYGRSFGVSYRDREFQGVQHNEGATISLTAKVGERTANVSTNNLSAGVLDQLIDRVVRMAQLASEDPYGALTPPELLSPVRSNAVLNVYDPEEPTVLDMERAAKEVERFALAVPGVSSSQGASAGWSYGEARSMATNGSRMHVRGTNSTVSVTVLAGVGDNREVGGFGHGAHWREDLLSLAEIGARAGRYATEKLGSRKIPSCRAPVIFDRRVAFSLVGAFLGNINGNSIFHKQTFLDDPLGKQIFPKEFSLIEDPFRTRGLNSRVCDAAGMVPFEGAIVEAGVVKTLMIDLYNSRRLGCRPTGHSGGASNLTVPAGVHSPEQLRREAGRGLLVTGIMGASGSPYTGDFSMGVSGFWFEQGEIAHPVSELTIAGNYKDLFGDLLIGSDLEMLAGANAPSLLLQPIAIGGS